MANLDPISLMTDGWFESDNTAAAEGMEDGGWFTPEPASFEVGVSPYFEVESGGIPSWKSASPLPGPWLRKYGGKSYATEKKLFRSFVTEAYNNTGVTLEYYITTYDTTYDKIFGEDCDRRFVRKFEFQARYKLPEELKLWTKFSIEGLDDFSMFIAKDHFKMASTVGHPLVAGNVGVGTYPSYIPQEGDILRSLFNNMLYEVITIREVAMRYHLSDSYVWEFQVRKYQNENLSLSPDSSASMDFLSAYTSSPSADIFNVAKTAQDKFDEIKYEPKNDEVRGDWPSFNNF